MPYFGESNLKKKPGTTVYLRDFKHAAKIFEPGAFDLAPKFKFLFHTYFNINPVAYAKNINTGDNFGLLVKTIKLPSFSLKTQEMNQYNRKRIVQSKINYEPVSITFHDDNTNVITKLWDAYYNYYYADESNFNQSSGVLKSGNSLNSYNNRTIYNSDIKDNNWGYAGESFKSGILNKTPFFKDIVVYGFNRHNFTSYTLINPLITRIDHDTYSYSDGAGTMEIRMDINYETVVYNQGSMDGETPETQAQGFGMQSSYDKTLSPIATKQTNTQILGKTGYAAASGGTVKPLKESESRIDDI